MDTSNLVFRTRFHTLTSHPTDHLWWHRIRSAILDDLIAGRPFWMTSHPVDHDIPTMVGKSRIHHLSCHSKKWRENLGSPFQVHSVKVCIDKLWGGNDESLWRRWGATEEVMMRYEESMTRQWGAMMSAIRVYTYKTDKVVTIGGSTTLMLCIEQ